MKNTCIVNLVGPPGCGKSTMAASIFAELKWLDIDCELVTEFAKDLTWEDRQETLKNQIYIFAKQHHRVNKLNGKVDIIITDSPLFLSAFYNDKYCDNNFKQLNALVLEQYYKLNNLNFFLNRVKKYNPNGRNQTEEESDLIGKEIKLMLDKNLIEYKTIDATKANVSIIVEDILKKIEFKNSMKCWREKGCMFNSNFPSFMKCQRSNYSVLQCKIDNENK